jgi:Anthrone oxygenase
MHYFDILTILCVGFMIGNELAVSVFINPVVWQLESNAQAKALSLFAGLLGKAMPFWYGLCLLLMLSEAYVRRHEAALPSLLVAAGIWIAVVIYTLAALVPINNRIAVLEAGALPAGWRQDHKRWDTLHRWRILFLTVAMVFLLHGILQ